jgi:hypothetical protein
MVRRRSARHHWSNAAVSIAIPCAVAALSAVSLSGCGSSNPAALTSTSNPQADSVTACDKPITSFARFWADSIEPIPGEYTGTDKVGAARVPAMSMYISGGSAGNGTFCVSARAGSHKPIQSVAAPRQGAIAYLGTAQSIAYFGTRPGVTRVTMTFGSLTTTYSLHGAEEDQLQSLGNGWHAVSTGSGVDGGPITLRAYNSHGKLVDTVTNASLAGKPTPSPS